MDSQPNVHVDVTLEYPPICSLSLWERARVRGFSGMLSNPITPRTKKPADN
jgi:hypothetical protein